MVPNDIAVIKLSIHFDMDDMEIEELPPCSDAIDPSAGHSCRNILESKGTQLVWTEFRFYFRERDKMPKNVVYSLLTKFYGTLDKD